MPCEENIAFNELRPCGRRDLSSRQVVKLLQYLAYILGNSNLDPAVWMSNLGAAYSHVCREVPTLFVGVDFSLFVLFGLLILFEADLRKWRREREMLSQGYRQLENVDDDDGPTDKALEDLYTELDEDGGGSIDREEMARYLSTLFVFMP